MTATELGNKPAMNAIDVLRDYLNRTRMEIFDTQELHALARIERLVEADKRKRSAGTAKEYQDAHIEAMAALAAVLGEEG